MSARTGPALAPLFVSVTAAAYVVVLGWALTATSFDVWGGLLVAPVLIALTVPLARRVATREQDPAMGNFIIVALVLKLVASLVRYAVAFSLYDGVADANAYHKAGVDLARSFRLGVFDLGKDQIVGTGFVKILTGVVYTFTGPTKIGGFLIFSWAGFWGLYFFYRAFCIALPDADHRRYARLVFLLPSLLFWPSSIGKEAWMMLTLGLGCLGAAKLFAGRRGGVWLLLLGGVGTAMVRPHVTLILVVAATAGVIARRPTRVRRLGPVTKWLVVLLLLGASAVAVSRVETFFGLDKLDTQSVNQVLNQTQKQTAQGGSSFHSPGAGSVAKMPNSLVTILFRPFPWEAHNPQGLAASLEGVALGVIMWRGRRRVFALRHELLKSPYLTFSAVYVLLFVFAFSSIENFGILARQRVQMLPLLLVLLSLRQPPPAAARARPAFEFVRAD